MSDLPLAGRRILVTRAANQAGKLSDALRALGAEPVEVPVLEIRPPASYEPLDRALLHLSNYNWLILTSANAVRSLERRARVLGIQSVAPQGLKVAAVGSATAGTAQGSGFHVTFVPESYASENLVIPLAKEASGQRILIARAAIARDVIPDVLRAAGAEVDVVEAYSNALPDSAPDLLRRALSSKIDAATFTSSSSVTHLAEAARAAGLSFPFAGISAVSIGPITSQTLRESGWPPAAEARVSDIPRLVDAVVSLFSQG